MTKNEKEACKKVYLALVEAMEDLYLLDISPVPTGVTSALNRLRSVFDILNEEGRVTVLKGGCEDG